EEQNLMVSAEQLLRALSHVSDVRDGSKDCSRILSEALNGTTYFVNIARIGADGLVLCAALPETMKLSVKDNPLFAAAQTSDRMVVGNVQQSQVVHRPVIGAMVPLHDEIKRFTGTLALGLDVRWLDYMMQNADVPKDAVVAVFDKSGALVSSNNAPVA